MLIRVILIGAALCCVVFAMRGTGSSRQLAVRRMAMLAFAGAWVVAVLSPDSLTRIAVWVGVGRGTDLLLYALVVVVTVSLIGIYQRFVRLEQRVADLTRELAIATVQRAPEAQPELRLVQQPTDDVDGTERIAR